MGEKAESREASLTPARLAFLALSAPKSFKTDQRSSQHYFLFALFWFFIVHSCFL